MNKFIVDEMEYCIVKKPNTGGPMIVRVDGIFVDNRKEICRRFLRVGFHANFFEFKGGSHV